MVSRFYRSYFRPSSFLLPQLRAPDLSGHCRTSAASSRSQWALLDLNCELQISVGRISVGIAGPQPRAPDSTASSRSQWALPSLNCELQISVGTAIVPVPCCACWLNFHIPRHLLWCFVLLCNFHLYTRIDEVNPIVPTRGSWTWVCPDLGSCKRTPVYGWWMAWPGRFLHLPCPEAW